MSKSCNRPENNTPCVLVSGTIAPAREIPKEDTLQIILANLNLVVPVVAAVLVIIVAIIVICVLRGKGNYNKGKCGFVDILGTIAPARDMPGMRMLFPWIPDWVEWNIAVPVAATVVVVVVGIVVVCVALSRKAHGPLQTRLHSDCMCMDRFFSYPSILCCVLFNFFPYVLQLLKSVTDV